MSSTAEQRQTVRNARGEARAAMTGGARSPTPEQIRLRAYQIFEARRRSGAPGDAASDWAHAERELCRGVHGASVTGAGRARDVRAIHEQVRGETLLRSGE